MRSIPFAIIVRRVKSNAYICPFLSYDVTMHVIFEGGVFYFVYYIHIKNNIVLCELRQYWFEFIAIYKTEIPCVNFMNKVQWEVIKKCVILGQKLFFFRQV